MNSQNRYQRLSTQVEAITPWLTEWVNVQQGSGLILFYWLFVTSFLTAIVLICAGAAYVSGWLFFLGLVSVRFFIYLFQIGGGFLDRIDPSHG
ncbi:MAG TPA: hypothetical protein ENI99_01030 [Sedimenticola sp.]|nr:hypothetical protein [Sedimenticola sp.]